MPLLVVVYFALMRRSPISGLFMGAVVGLAQDSLSKNPLGMFGIVNTLVGYFAASVGLRLDVDHTFIRLLLSFFFYVFHQVFYWVMARALLGQQTSHRIPADARAGAAECGGRHLALSLPRSAAGNARDCRRLLLAILQFTAWEGAVFAASARLARRFGADRWLALLAIDVTHRGVDCAGALCSRI